MNIRLLSVAFLLFLTGFCALIYQTVWLREFRLIFGSSTAASAAVLAIFMGGLGAGSLILGRKVDRKARPLRFYGKIELIIAGTTISTPALLWGAEHLYITICSTTTVGPGFGMLLRAALAMVVMGAPTFLMGGTLPAAARAIETDTDQGRRHLALLYGMNTLGAVLGVALSTFFLLELLGNRLTLWLGCLLNAFAGLAALTLSNQAMFAPEARQQKHRSGPQPGVGLVPGSEKAIPSPLILVASAAAGFAFLLMELVWYRMLGPLLGGSTFTFGLILSIALLGIGVGGIAYAAFKRNRPPSLHHLALTFALEGVLLAIPYALGDRLALLALLLQPLGVFGFAGRIAAWAVVTLLLVLPAAIVSGFQFPLLIALLGQGHKNVGRHTGLGYASNTLGAILGALAGGFGLLPLLSAPGAWILVIVLLLALSLCLAVFSWKLERPLWPIPQPVAIALATLPLLFATGPTAVWRQLPIGAGILPVPASMTRNNLHDWFNQTRRNLLLERDGIESCVGITTQSAVTFLINGKADGNSRADASTQIMSGLLGALLHPNPKESLVIGLGTGSTAGWLGVIPGMERVDVMELEPVVERVAELCAPVNQNALGNRKVHVQIGDARELLLTSPRRYDIIFSEPSNPYRAGISSLFTAEFYKAVSQRLRNDGSFIQWVQAYDIDAKAVQTIYATLHSVFPNVETWQTNNGDMLFIASKAPPSYRLPELRARITQEPYRSALAWAWRVTDLEGLMAHYVANTAFADTLARKHRGGLNTDNCNHLEFAFARSVGTGKLNGFSLASLRDLAKSQSQARPSLVDGEIDWNTVETRRLSMMVGFEVTPTVGAHLSEPQRERAQALSYYLQGRPQLALQTWRAEVFEPEDITEVAMVAELLADEGDEQALPYLNKLKVTHPTEAALLLGRLRLRQGRMNEAADALEAGFIGCRTDPWVHPPVLGRSFDVAVELARIDGNRPLAIRLHEALKAPFSVCVSNEKRLMALVRTAQVLDGEKFTLFTLNAIEGLEPHIPWDRDFLSRRYHCYLALCPEKADAALKDLKRFEKHERDPIFVN